MSSKIRLVVKLAGDTWDVLEGAYVEVHPVDHDPEGDEPLEEFDLSNPDDLRALADLIEKTPGI